MAKTKGRGYDFNQTTKKHQHTMKNHVKTWAAGILFTLAAASFCGTARADLQVYTNDTGIVSWDTVNGSSPFYTSIASANLSLVTQPQGQPSVASGTTAYTVLSEIVTITNGGFVANPGKNYVLKGIGLLGTTGNTNLSLHIFDVTANLTSGSGTIFNGSGATYNFTANGDLVGAGVGLSFFNPVAATRQTIFTLSTGPNTQDQIVLGSNHTYAVEIWTPAGGAGLTWMRLPADSPLDVGGQGMGSHDADFGTARLTITSLGLAGGAPRTLALALYGTQTTAAPTVNTVVNSGSVSNHFVDRFNPAGISTNNYSAGAIGNVWTNWFGTAYQSVTWDSANDANGNLNSGSMLITANFDNVGNGQFTVFDNFNGINPPINGFEVTSVQCDVRFDSTSPTTVNGGVTNYGHLQVGTRSADNLSQIYFGSIEVPVENTNWVHLSFPVNAAVDTNLTLLHDVLLHIYGPWYNATPLIGTTKLWVDNIKFVGPLNPTQAGPPTIAPLSTAVPALRIFAGDTAQTYQREQIATMGQSGVSWYNNGGATYSVTITNFPQSFPGYEFHIFLIPTTYLPYADPYGNSFAEYDSSNLLALRIIANITNVVASAYYKVNSPSGNPTNLLANIGSPTAVGTWTLSFSDNTHGLLTTPGGATTNFTIAPSDAATFADPMVAYYGVSAFSVAGEGQAVDVTRIQMPNLILDDHFNQDSSLDTNTTWRIVASVPASIWLTGPAAKYWMNWSLPDTGYGLAESTNLTSTWVLPSLFNGHTVSPAQALLAGRRWALITTNCLPPASTKNVFFSLQKPAPIN